MGMMAADEISRFWFGLIWFGFGLVWFYSTSNIVGY